ncbi:MAG: HAMP domain-containing protein, partial [Spirochaetales bacterium]|nr:HAMP domain-containing protein [Spirochaetales bacterium]
MKKNEFNRSIRNSLMILVLVVSLLVTASIAFISISRTRSNNLDYASHHLESITKVKKVVLEDYFSVMEGKIHVIKDNPFVQTALTDLDDAFMSHEDSIDSDEWRSRASLYDPLFQDICRDLEIDDIILMCPEGSIVYTGSKHDDLGLFVTDDKLKNTSFGKAFRFLQNSPDRDVVISDFEPYDPKGGEPMAFLVGRMTEWKTGELIGHVVFSISRDYINKIVNEKTGMGETGNSILTAFSEDGFLTMRSDLEISGSQYSVGDLAGITSLDKELKEKTSGTEIITDSGEPVLASYMPLEHSDIHWSIISRQSVKEINNMVAGTVIIIVLVSILALILALGAAYLLSSLIIRSIKSTTKAFQDIGEGDGDLTKRIAIQSRNETGEMSYYFNAFLDKLNIIVSGIKRSTGDTIHLSHSLKENMDETEKFSRDIAGITQEV